MIFYVLQGVKGEQSQTTEDVTKSLAKMDTIILDDTEEKSPDGKGKKVII